MRIFGFIFLLFALVFGIMQLIIFTRLGIKIGISWTLIGEILISGGIGSIFLWVHGKEIKRKKEDNKQNNSQSKPEGAH